MEMKQVAEMLYKMDLVSVWIKAVDLSWISFSGLH